MTLTQAQRDARKNRLTASRVGVLMNGSEEDVLRLYREMIGEEAEEDLSDVWAVQLGSVTEKLNLDWYERKNRVLLTRRGEVVMHGEYSFAAATLDGWDPNLECPIECKHVGGREPHEVIIGRYQPQMQWQMFVTYARQCCLSVIRGADEPLIDYIPRNDSYIKEMVSRAASFMLCVDLRQPPHVLPPAPTPVDAQTIYDMNANQVWTTRAKIWLQTYQAAENAKDAEKALKSLVPEDAKKCFGAGVRVTRDRAGRLSLRKDS